MDDFPGDSDLPYVPYVEAFPAYSPDSHGAPYVVVDVQDTPHAVDAPDVPNAVVFPAMGSMDWDISAVADTSFPAACTHRAQVSARTAVTKTDSRSADYSAAVTVPPAPPASVSPKSDY